MDRIDSLSIYFLPTALNVFQNTGSNQIEGQRAGPSDCSGWLNHRAQNRTKGPMTSTGIFNAGVLDNFFEVVSSFCGATGYLTVEGWFLPSAPKPG